MTIKKTVSIFLLFYSVLIVYAQKSKKGQTFFQDSKTMSELWELDSEDENNTFVITSYKPIYLIPVKWSSSPNGNPQSENSDNALPEGLNIKPYEAKFQLSIKTKIFHDMLWGTADLWGAYSQDAYWQIYNKDLSRPFRELNYEPEIILNFPTNFPIFGFKARMFGVALNHQSNGRAEPISRSWNRIIFHGGFERNNWQVYLRAWIQLHDSDDDNPEIKNYIGRAEANVIYDWGVQRFTAIATNSLKFGGQNRGSIQLNWTFPIEGNFSALVQVFNGYGETLIDYNHRQTTIGIGVSLMN